MGRILSVRMGVLIILFGLSFLCQTQAGVVYVKPTGSDNNTGESWSLAKQTVTAGLIAAVSGDQVWVAAGTYNGCIALKSGVALYGGFAGIDNQTPSQRNFVDNETILDGQQGGSVVTSPEGADNTTRIDGFTIDNGTGTLLGDYTYGGGIYCDHSSPTIANNTFIDNNAYFGGGIYCGSSSPTISNNAFIWNNASQGGGIFCNDSASHIADNTFIGNIASNGGGIYFDSSSPTISNNTISGNSASIGGGIYCYDYDSSPTISNNTISENSASYGGGIFCGFSSPTISNNTISGNGASSSCGGGIYCDWSSLTLANNIIAFNSSGIYNNYSTADLHNNCVYNPNGDNYTNLSEGGGNISLDPKLEAAAYGKFHLLDGSPCIDMGNDTYVQPGQVDMDGQARRYDNSTVDIGADEYDTTVYTFTPSIIRVSPSGSDANDGSSWALAKQTVQAGIDAASVVGGEVWVAEGVYNERVVLWACSYLYGGFGDNETKRDQRNWQSHVTVLDGQQAGSVVTAISPGYLLCGIDGFTIDNGTGTLSESARYGGGILCLLSSPSIANNTISGNNANYGGGIYCEYSSPPIANNTISGNNANYGGGILCLLSSPSIVNNTIIADNASEYGGGIFCEESSPSIANNTIRGNSSGNGGGIFCELSSPSIANNTLSENSASYGGGGIYCYGSSPSITNNTIIADNASEYGGGIYCYWSSPSIANNTISGNSSTYYGGGIYCASSSPSITNNTISGNNADFGGGICCNDSFPSIANNTISGNSGDGICNFNYSSPSIANNIIAFNSSGIVNYYSTPDLHNNCVYNPGGDNYTGLSAGTGDINLDPLFVDNATGNFHLTPNSPCIDQGSDNDTQPSWVDMDNETRIAGPHVDIGADEYPFTILADCDRDGHVTDLDLAIVLGSMDLSFGQAGYWGKADLDGDGEITSTDLSIVMENME